MMAALFRKRIRKMKYVIAMLFLGMLFTSPSFARIDIPSLEDVKSALEKGIPNGKGAYQGKCNFTLVNFQIADKNVPANFLSFRLSKTALLGKTDIPLVIY